MKLEVDWSKVDAFHLDEYVGLPTTHPGPLAPARSPDGRIDPVYLQRCG